MAATIMESHACLPSIDPSVDASGECGASRPFQQNQISRPVIRSDAAIFLGNGRMGFRWLASGAAIWRPTYPPQTGIVE
jgi:hypothetical protein